MKARYTSKLLALVIVVAGSSVLCAQDGKEDSKRLAAPASSAAPVVTWSEWASKRVKSVKDNGYGVWSLVWHHEDALPAVVWAKRAAAITLACITCAKIHEYIIAPVVEAVQDASDDEADARQEARKRRRDYEQM